MKEKEIINKDVNENLEESASLLDIRERMQYSAKSSLSEEEYELMKIKTKHLLDKIRNEIERVLS